MQAQASTGLAPLSNFLYPPNATTQSGTTSMQQLMMVFIVSHDGESVVIAQVMK